MADPWQEGLQLDQLKIYEEGKLNETLYRVLLAGAGRSASPASLTVTGSST